MADPPFTPPKIIDQTHAETMHAPQSFFAGVTAEQVPGGACFATVKAGRYIGYCHLET